MVNLFISTYFLDCYNLDIDWLLRHLLQNKLLTYLWYLNLGCTLRGLGLIQKFNDDNDDEDQYRCQW